MSLKTRTLLTALSALGLPSSVAGWWDEGHMLSTAITKSLLSEETVQKYENVLKCSDNQGEWANFTDLVRATVWMKHVRCNPSDTGDSCAGIDPKHRHGFRLMDDWGEDETPWKPPTSDSGYFPPWNETNLTLPSQYNLFAQDTIGRAVSFLMERPTSAWSLGFHLRVFLNVFTNLHQRLNAGSYHDKIFPDGRGQHHLRCVNGSGNLSGRCQSIPGVVTLWDLYESGCGGMTRSWSSLVEDDNAYVTRRAADVAATHLPDYFIRHALGRLSEDWDNADKNYGFGEGLKDDFTDAIKRISDDSMVNWHRIWFEYSSNASRDTFYAPGSFKFTVSRDAALKQIAVAGYRLASWLNALAPYIPDEAPCDLSAQPAPAPTPAGVDEVRASRWGIAIAAVVSFVVGGGVAYVFALWAKKENNNNELEAGLAAPQALHVEQQQA